MSNIPDFVLQIQEVERNLKATWTVVKDDWRDSVAQQYNDYVIDIYVENFSKYITGNGIKGYGIDDLMSQMDKHMQDMADLTGISENVQFAFAAGPLHNGRLNNAFNNEMEVESLHSVQDNGGVVHDSNRDRFYWDEHNDGAKPGELNNNDIVEIYNQKK